MKKEKKTNQDSKKIILSFDNVTKKYGSKYANKGVTFKVYKGDRIGLIGANGAGKTSLVEQLIGITKSTSGKIDYLFNYKKRPQEKMGMQFQISSYPPGLSVKNIIVFSLRVYGADVDKKYLFKLLDHFNMLDFYHAPAKSLSGGQLQKLNVLLALLHKPEILILDEISTGLDISARDDILNHVEELVKSMKTTTFLVSHYMHEIERICNRVIILSRGQIVMDTTVAKIKKKYGSLDKYMWDFLNQDRKKGGKDA